MNSIIDQASALLGDVMGTPAGRLRDSGLWAIRKDALAGSAHMARESRDDNIMKVNSAGRRGERLASGTYATRIGSVAIVPVLGPLVDRTSWRYWSYDEIIRDLNLALADDDISAILLDVNSPGGMVSGCDECASFIRDAAGQKPLAAHIGGIGASAAFWLASAAPRVTASRTANIGSVGALIHYLDIEGIFTNLGAKKVEVVATQSPNKRLEPDSEEGRAEMQAIVDGAAELFIEGIATFRGVNREDVLNDYGQGLVFKAEDALERGMIDAVSSFEGILAELSAARPGNTETGPVAAAAPAIEDEDMDFKDLTMAALQEARPDLITAIMATTDTATIETAARSAGAEAERDRVAGIEAQAIAGHEKLITEAKADGVSTGADVAMKIVAAERALREARVNQLAADDALVAGVTAAAAPTGEAQKAGTATTPEGWKTEFEASPDLQSEFGKNVDAYVAYQTGVSEGRVHLKTAPTA